MFDETVKEYCEYIKIDVAGEIKCIQDVIDNMLTRLEELTSVLQNIKFKNNECGSAVSDDINKYRLEVITLSKKIKTLEIVMRKLHNNVATLEKRVEKAEFDFGISNESKIKSFLIPFLKRNKDLTANEVSALPLPKKIDLQSIGEHFRDND